MDLCGKPTCGYFQSLAETDPEYAFLEIQTFEQGREEHMRLILF